METGMNALGAQRENQWSAREGKQSLEEWRVGPVCPNIEKYMTGVKRRRQKVLVCTHARKTRNFVLLTGSWLQYQQIATEAICCDHLPQKRWGYFTKATDEFQELQQELQQVSSAITATSVELETGFSCCCLTGENLPRVREMVESRKHRKKRSCRKGYWNQLPDSRLRNYWGNVLMHWKQQETNRTFRHQSWNHK